ncbi:MAG: Gfo/Idh/MocA family oxidoreductase, partial [Pseudomonadota bacterium]
MIQAALIGTGYWGPNIAKSLELTGKAKIRALCDAHPGHLAAVARRYPDARATADARDIFADPEISAVAIATPVHTHHELAARALEAGKHVLVEKPLALTSDQAADLVIIAQQANRVLMVGHVFQFNPGIRALKNLMDAGDLGDIHYLHFERTNLGPVRTEVNALWDLATHDISIFCDLLDAAPVRVSATGKSFLNPDVEDVVFATFEFAGGQLAQVHASWLNPRKVRQLVVTGSRRMALWDDMDQKTPVRVYDKRVEIPSPGEGGDTYQDFKTLCVDGATTEPPVPPTPPLLAECEHFLDCVETGKKPRTDGPCGLTVVRLLEAATQSL